MTAPIIVKRGEIADIPAIIPIMEISFDPVFGEAWNENQCLGMLTLPGTILYLAYCGEDLAGFALSRFTVDETELLLLAVTPLYQKIGIGAALLSSIIDWSQDCGAQRTFLEVRDDNNAMHLYYKFGFLAVGRRPRYYRGNDGQCRDAITLTLDFLLHKN
jgi:[ribosomal protein S18]-alanine N-acetyltransferase